MSYHKLSVSLLGEEDEVPQEEQQRAGLVVGSRRASPRMAEQRSGGYVGMNGEAGDRVCSEQKVNKCSSCELDRGCVFAKGESE